MGPLIFDPELAYALNDVPFVPWKKDYYRFRVPRGVSYLVGDFLEEFVPSWKNKVKYPCVSADTIYDQVEENISYETLYEVLNTLTERERTVLILRYGLKGNKPHTLKQIGKKFNVNSERIRQIEAKALRKMRHPSRSKLLLPYLPFTPLTEEKEEKPKPKRPKKKISKEVLIFEDELSDDEHEKAIEKQNKQIELERKAVQDNRKKQSCIERRLKYINDKKEEEERKRKELEKEEASNRFYLWYCKQVEAAQSILDPEAPLKKFRGDCKCKTWQFLYNTYADSFPIGCIKCETKFMMEYLVNPIINETPLGEIQTYKNVRYRGN